MKVGALLERLRRLEAEGRGACDLYVVPTRELCQVSHRPGDGVVVGFDLGDHPVEKVDDIINHPEDADAVFLEFGAPAGAVAGDRDIEAVP